MILVMNGASRSMQSSQVGTGSREHCFTGACRTSWAVLAMLSGVNDIVPIQKGYIHRTDLQSFL